MIWLLILGAVIGISLLPIGIQLRYATGGPEARLLIGPVKLQLYPSKQKEKQRKSQFSEKRKQSSNDGGKVSDFLPLLQVLIDLLSELRYKAYVSFLDLRLVLGGSDPCKIGLDYGRAWIVLGNILPLLENIFRIKKRNLHVEADYMASETTIYASVDIAISAGRAIYLLLVYGFQGLRKYLNIINNKKAVQ